MAVGTFRPPRSFCVWCRTYRTTRSSRVRPSRTSGILSRTYVTSISIITPPPPGGRKVQPRPQPHPSSTRAQRNAPQRERGHSVCRSGPVVHGAARRTEWPRSPRNHSPDPQTNPRCSPGRNPNPGSTRTLRNTPQRGAGTALLLRANPTVAPLLCATSRTGCCITESHHIT